jgi:hypothetical protein
MKSALDAATISASVSLLSRPAGRDVLRRGTLQISAEPPREFREVSRRAPIVPRGASHRPQVRIVDGNAVAGSSILIVRLPQAAQINWKEGKSFITHPIHI